MLIYKASYDEETSRLISINRTAIDFLESRMKSQIDEKAKYCRTIEDFYNARNEIIEKYSKLAEPYIKMCHNLFINNPPKIEIVKKGL